MKIKLFNRFNQFSPSSFLATSKTSLFSSMPGKGIEDLRKAYLKDPKSVEQWPPEKIASYLQRTNNKYLSTRQKAADITPITSVADIQQVIREAKSTQTVVRTVGSAHSVTEAIYADSNKKGLNLKLSGVPLKRVDFLEEGVDAIGSFARVRVGAGCHLGQDPSDSESSIENSLNYQLTQSGYSLPIVGGITHQSVGGFMQTGSAGGSVFYGLADSIESFKFVNGRGDIIEAMRGTDIFNAAGVSMGLMGILTEVTFKVRKNYTVISTEEIKTEEDSWLMQSTQGQYPFETELQNNQYIHLNWFAQPGVRRVLQWTGTRAPTFKEQSNPPYKAYENTLSSWWASEAATVVFEYTDDIRRKSEISSIDLSFIAFLFNAFLPLTTSFVPLYRDDWYKILATEDTVPVDSLIKTMFTEIWFPTNQTTRVINILKELYIDPKVALGNYALEMYGAHESPFWLSPAYGRNVVRIDPLWWAYNKSNPADFFKFFFDKMLDIPGARLHWGKYLPQVNQVYGNKTVFNLDYLKQCYPKMNEWLKIREEMDPYQVFVTDYWRKLFLNPTLQPQPGISMKL